MNDTTPNTPHWYALRVTYGRELKVQAALGDRFKTYVPKCYKTVERFGRRSYELAAQVPNLIFIYSTLEELKSIKQNDKAGEYLRFMLNHEGKYIFVKDKEMEDFMRVAALPEEKLIPIDISEENRLKGQKVRIIEGDLVGVEGRIMRLQGNKKVVVNVGDLIAVAITYIPASWVIKIED